MKKSVIIVMMMCTMIMYSQKKKNGTVYKEHPAITDVEAMQQADFAGDADKVATYLADNFRSFDGTNRNKDAKGTDKETFLQWINDRKDWVSYMSITRQNGAYPDAIQYDDDDGLWVQTWDYIRGIHNATGVKIDMPIHRLYYINKDGKIATIIDYSANIGREIRQSFNPRTNGTIYDHHEYINKVRRMMGALEHGDVDKAFSFFTDDATFSNLDMADGKTNSVSEEKEGFKQLLENWTIESIDVQGYPDYLEYELGKAKVVQSWWRARLTRKSDGKKVILPIMLTHDFNDEGMITSENGYYTTASLAD